MKLYYNKQSDPNNLDIALDEVFCLNHQWDFESIDIPNFDLNKNILILKNGKIEIGKRVIKRIEKTPLQKEALKYGRRKQDGVAYSDLMNAELNLSKASDADKSVIDQFFAQTQVLLEGGKWKSALREINSLKANKLVSQKLIDERKKFIQKYVDENY